MVRRYHVHSDAAQLSPPGCHHGLGEPQVLTWQLSNTMGTDSCIEALEEAIAKYGTPQIFNSDQCSQFTSPRFTRILKEAGIKISRWMDNAFIERLWRSLKYECVYLLAFESGTEARNGIGAWLKILRRAASALGARRWAHAQ
jgi:putative transposase